VAKKLVLAMLVSLLLACVATSKQPKLVEDVIPITMANMRGHQALYDEGWFVITSSEQALEYAIQKSVISSKEAATAAASSIASRDDKLAETLASDWKLSADLGKKTFDTGNRLRREMFSATSGLASLQVDYGKKKFKKSWGRFIKGNLYIGQRTQSTRESLANQPGDYFNNLSKDFSNIYDITANMQDDYATEIGTTWSNAFSDAAQVFNASYEKSGQSSNTFEGLGHVLLGYAKGLYQGLFKPAAITAKDTVSVGAHGAAQLVFLPTATVISVSGRTIQSIGTTVYYSGKLGVEIISPTVEAGLLSGMAILSLGTASITYVTGASIGAVNQVAFTAAAPVVTAGSGTALTVAETGKYVAFVSYDAAVGTSKVIINQASAAVVLGYNALTALPAHLFMGTVDGAVFLAYDGPRLVIAYAKGEVRSDDGEVTGIDSLPVGSVVDLTTLQNEGIEVEVLSENPAVIKKVLEALPNDLRE